MRTTTLIVGSIDTPPATASVGVCPPSASCSQNRTPEPMNWLTPAKRWIHQVGLTPDVVVTLPDPVPAGTDPTLDKALEILAGAAAAPLHQAAA